MNANPEAVWTDVALDLCMTSKTVHKEVGESGVAWPLFHKNCVLKKSIFKYIVKKYFGVFPPTICWGN